jgi:hypothetical protein
MSLDCSLGEARSMSNALCDRLGTRPWDLVCGRLDIFRSDISLHVAIGNKIDG